jgi:hypothetical protein
MQPINGGMAAIAFGSTADGVNDSNGETAGAAVDNNGDDVGVGCRVDGCDRKAGEARDGTPSFCSNSNSSADLGVLAITAIAASLFSDGE